MLTSCPDLDCWPYSSPVNTRMAVEGDGELVYCVCLVTALDATTLQLQTPLEVKKFEVGDLNFLSNSPPAPEELQLFLSNQVCPQIVPPLALTLNSTRSDAMRVMALHAVISFLLPSTQSYAELTTFIYPEPVCCYLEKSLSVPRPLSF